MPDYSGQWKVPSSSSDSIHTVSLTVEGEWQCSCIGWTRHMPRRDCRHITTIKARQGGSDTANKAPKKAKKAPPAGPVTQPMLAGKVTDFEALRFPVVGSPKLDGIRCLMVGGKALTRKFKSVPNRHICSWLEANMPDGFDGELMVRVGGVDGTFSQVTSGIMSEDGEPDFIYNVFDWVHQGLEQPFEDRVANYRAWIESYNDKHPGSHVAAVPQVRLANMTDLRAAEELYLSQGYEGLMIRDPSGPYKCGRSTEAEQFLLKVKRFEDSEAEVLGMVPQFHNENELVEDAFGYAKRSSAKAGKVAMETCGALQLRDLKTGIEFECGTGLDSKTRLAFWANPKSIVGKVVRYRFQSVGVKEKPRFPTFVGLRDERDMGGE